MRLDDRQWLGLFLLAGTGEFAIGMTIAEAVYPGYSVSRNFISDLGVGSAAAVFNTSIILLGLAVIVSAWFFHRAFRDRILSIFVMIAGVGAVGVGVFTEDFDALHSIVSLVTFVFSGLSLIVAFRVVRPPFNYLSILLGVFSLVALGLYVSGTYLGLDRGGMERMIVWPVLVWGMAAGGYFLGGPTPVAEPPASS